MQTYSNDVIFALLSCTCLCGYFIVLERQKQLRWKRRVIKMQISVASGVSYSSLMRLCIISSGREQWIVHESQSSESWNFADVFLLSPERPHIPASPGSYTTPRASETSEANMKPNQTKTELNLPVLRAGERYVVPFAVQSHLMSWFKLQTDFKAADYVSHFCFWFTALQPECEKWSGAACLNRLGEEISYQFHIVTIWQSASGCRAT